MEKLLKSNSIKFEKSSYSFELLQHSSGENYLSIIQHSKDLEYNSIKIREINCLEFINGFSKFLFDKNISESLYKSVVTFEEEQAIITNFLKGVSLKDLELTTGNKQEELIKILVKNNIEIVDGISLEKKRYYYKGKKK